MILSLLGYMLLGVFAVLVIICVLMILMAIYEVAQKNEIVMIVCIGIVFGILAWFYFEVMGYGTPPLINSSLP